MNFFCKVIKDDIDVSCDKKTFRNIEFILLFKKADVVTMFCKLVAEVAKSRSREGELGKRSRWKYILAGYIKQGIENIGSLFISKSIKTFFALHYQIHIKRRFFSINNDRNLFLILFDFECFFCHKDRIAFTSFSKACRFQNSSSTDFLCKKVWCVARVWNALVNQIHSVIHFYLSVLLCLNVTINSNVTICSNINIR